MPLEATMMIIDNSEYMRNGDYQPTRFDAQADAVNAIFQTKIDSNPENTVGIMTMAGKGPEVLVTHTKELGQILSAIHSTSEKIGGETNIPTAIAVAQLALKHRQNKNLRQRIIVFVGSPLHGTAADEQSMIKLAKKLKKNSVAVDFISFGDGIQDGTSNVLRSFAESASSGENSHYVSIPPSTLLLSDVILSSAILSADRGIPDELIGEAGPSAGSTGATAGSGQFEFGVDPSLDPELAMALRMSMEEEQARQAATQQQQQQQQQQQLQPVSADTSSTTKAAEAETIPADPTDEEEEAMLRQALAMSEEQDVDMGDANEDDEEMTEEDAINRAIAMSMKQDEDEQKKKT